MCTISHWLNWALALRCQSTRDKSKLGQEAGDPRPLFWYTRVWPRSRVKYWPVNAMQWLKWITNWMKWSLWEFLFSNVGSYKEEMDEEWLNEWMNGSKWARILLLSVLLLLKCSKCFPQMIVIKYNMSMI